MTIVDKNGRKLKRKIASKPIKKEDFENLLIDLVTNSKVKPHDKEFLRRVYTTLYHLGLRVGELDLITWGKLKLGLHDGTISIEEKKTNNIRKVLLNKEYKNFINSFSDLEMRENQALLIHKRDRKFSGYDHKTLIRKINKHIRSVLGDKYSSHGFRHNYITNAYKKSGNNIKLANKLVGHKSINSTARYIEDNIEEMYRVINLL